MIVIVHRIDFVWLWRRGSAGEWSSTWKATWFLSSKALSSKNLV